MAGLTPRLVVERLEALLERATGLHRLDVLLDPRSAPSGILDRGFSVDYAGDDDTGDMRDDRDLVARIEAGVAVRVGIPVTAADQRTAKMEALDALHACRKALLGAESVEVDGLTIFPGPSRIDLLDSGEWYIVEVSFRVAFCEPLSESAEAL